MIQSGEHTGRDELPVIMLAEQSTTELIAKAEQSESGDVVGVATMQLSAQLVQEESLVWDVLGSLINAKERGADARVHIDERYVRTMTRIGNRDYPNWLPLGSASQRQERSQTRARTDEWLQILKEADILVGQKPGQIRRGYVPLMRHAGSLHVAQSPFAVLHRKAAYAAMGNGETTAWINTGNLTDSDMMLPSPNRDIGMSNLSLKLSGYPAAFVMKAVFGELPQEAGLHVYGDKVKVIHDVNNVGEPARLPEILVEALKAIDPRRVSVINNPFDFEPRAPKAIVMLSQYAPNGLLYNALKNAADSDTYVNIPMEPADDHRSKNFPYNVNNALFRGKLRRADSQGLITTGRREAPSHIKAQIVTYDDGTAKLVIGSDNFVTNLQKVVRNEELAVTLSLDFKRPEEANYFKELVELLSCLGEINMTTHDKLLEDIFI